MIERAGNIGFRVLTLVGAVTLAAMPATAQKVDPCVEVDTYLDPDADGRWDRPPSNTAALDAANRCIAERREADRYGQRAYIHQLMGNLDLAEADATQRIRLDSHPAAYRERGLIRQAAGRHEPAIADLREALNRNYPRPAWARQEIAASLRLQRRYDEALREVDASLRADPNFRRALYERGLIYDARGSWDEAVGAWTRYLATDANHALAHNFRARAFIELRRWREALADADRAIALDPRMATAFNNRGFALRNLGRYDESIAALRRATQVEPNDPAAWNNLCSYLTDAGDPAGALVACDRYARFDLTPAHHAYIARSRGLAHEALGDNAAAVRHYREALGNPDVSQASRDQSEAGLLRLGERP